jgi:type IV secretory pathway VirB4 component
MFSNKQRPLPTARISSNPTKTLSLVDKSGILLGDNCYWNPEKLANPHGAIIGSSGSGKTQTLKAIAWSILKQYPTKLIIIDFHGDQEIPGETCYRINMESSHGINPLVINLDREGGGPNLQSIQIAMLFKKILRLGPNQEGMILECLKKCYSDRGITQDDYQSWRNDPPNLLDLEQELLTRIDNGCKESAKLNLKLAATFQYGIFSKPQPNLNQKHIRVDLSKLLPELASIAADSLANQLMNSHRLLGECNSKIPKTILFIDEAKEMASSKACDRITADGRKYGLGLWVATQRCQHLTPEFLSNTITKIVLPVDASEVVNTGKKFRFDAQIIASLQPLNALVRLGIDSVKIKIKAYYERV